MRIEIWSDVVCPWCYIGKRRLERALEGFEHADEVEVVWRSFQLDPGAPTTPDESVAEHLGRKYGGGPEAGQRMIDQMEAAAAEEGLVFRLGQAQRVGTVDAHRLLHLAGDPGRGGSEALRGTLKEALLEAYFVEVQNVADHGTLARVAVAAGLDADRVGEVLASDAYAADVQADVDQAHAFGAGGVPFFVLGRALAVPGAAPVETFTQALQQAWERTHPALATVGAGGAGGAGAAVLAVLAARSAARTAADAEWA